MKEFFKYEKLRSTTELNWCNTVKYFHFEKRQTLILLFKEWCV